MSVEVVIPNATPGTGEGPHWDDSTRSLVFVDITQKNVFRWDSVTGSLQKVHLEDEVGCVVPCKKGGFLVAVGRTIFHLEWSSQKLTKLHEIPLKGVGNRFNDGKCDPAGRFWIGTMGKVLSFEPLTFDMEKGELYCLDVDGSFHKRLDKMTICNGLAWSSDHKTMYFIESIPGQIMAFDYDVTSGNICNRRTVVNFGEFDPTDPENLGIPDGMTIDTNDNIWVAFYGTGQVICFNPQTGKMLRKIEIPCKRTTSCCFGGENLDELYVTTAQAGSTEEEREAFPASGSVFRVTGLGVKGHPANVFNGNF
ncbi:regucalcin-like [Pecten maximus]|uniref:regucalcin-like n=1 Tax=Pecten maximus TaxID=6579 RepID=UPI001458B920|nr:regucalcin-like [Pecten maximus]XP_033737411.1 regucalcin-like [Pecten maximus]XP_033737413.1 regucalcin-like [Pecten maximus]XP_033737414.1 regucalcin-like [Pecten maximus]